MKKLYIFTLGFTSEFVTKPLLEFGVDRNTYIIVLYVSAGDEYSRKRVADAISHIERLAHEAGFIDRLSFRQITLTDNFYDTIYNVASAIVETLMSIGIRREDIGEVKVWLTGGMRILVLSALLSCKILFDFMGVPTTFNVWSEDGLYRYLFDTSLLNIDLKNLSIIRMEILKKIVALGEGTYDKLVDSHRNESTIRKLVEYLRRDGLMECRRSNRKTVCRATVLGRFLAKIHTLIEGFVT